MPEELKTNYVDHISIAVKDLEKAEEDKPMAVKKKDSCFSSKQLQKSHNWADEDYSDDDLPAVGDLKKKPKLKKKLKPKKEEVKDDEEEPAQDLTI